MKCNKRKNGKRKRIDKDGVQLVGWQYWIVPQQTSVLWLIVKRDWIKQILEQPLLWFNWEFIHDVWCYNQYIYLVGHVFVLWIRLVSFLISFYLLVHFFELRFSIFQNYFAIVESAFYVFDHVSAMDFSRRNNGSEIQVLTRLWSTAENFW